jgi:hypothetical protein
LVITLGIICTNVPWTHVNKRGVVWHTEEEQEILDIAMRRVAFNEVLATFREELQDAKDAVADLQNKASESRANGEEKQWLGEDLENAKLDLTDIERDIKQVRKKPETRTQGLFD